MTDSPTAEQVIHDQTVRIAFLERERAELETRIAHLLDTIRAKDEYNRQVLEKMQKHGLRMSSSDPGDVVRPNAYAAHAARPQGDM